MGALTSRQNATVEEADISSNHAYKYPPRSGTYFGSHFIMGGERFDTPQPESYLFGENGDLNFLGNRPTPFPYPPPQANEPTKTLKSLVNIRKESIRFVKAPDSATKIHGDGNPNKGNSFNVEFTFDSDAKCSITIYYFCVEDISSNGISFISRDSALTSETYQYKRGVNQTFSQNSHIFNPTLFSDDDLSYNSERDVLPIAIHCVVEEGIEESRQSHTTICVVDHHTDGTYVLRALKQKIFVDGLCYLLQEIYGIENKNINKLSNDEETEDNGSECVICMCDTRDTLILPCRHLCLCNSCADSLRYQANNCPICRAPFKALLQIRAVQKSSSNHPITPQENNCDNIPAGYVAVSLIEALNGPPNSSARTQISVGDNGENDIADSVQAADCLNRNLEKSGKATSTKDQEKLKEKMNQNTPEFRMSVLLSKEDGNVTKELLAKHSPLMSRAPASRDKNPREKGVLRPQPSTRDSLKLVNEKTATQSQDNDDDSDAEKLSPLLNSKSILSPNNNSINKTIISPLHIDGVEESIDDTDTDIEDTEKDVKNKKNRPNLNTDKEGMIIIGAEDSDYYTPEDPHTTILSPLYTDKENGDVIKSKENFSILSTPLSTLKESAVSLPDSPISGNSRSSGDSYSTSSSTRQLLASIPGSKETDYNGVKASEKERSINENTQ